jgi:hypothetical protein
VYAGHEILMEGDDNSAMIVGNQQASFLPAAKASPNPLVEGCYYCIKYSLKL